jgi:hypothetical protein
MDICRKKVTKQEWSFKIIQTREKKPTSKYLKIKIR